MRFLYIFVEGLEDKMLVASVLLPLFQPSYDQVSIQRYAEESTEKLSRKIGTIISKNQDYIIFGDFDSGLCIRTRIQDIKDKFGNQNLNSIYIVIKEIESWYLAGLDLNCQINLGVRSFSTPTDNIGKGAFRRLMPRNRFVNVRDFMQEILRYYSLHEGKRSNNSLQYFCNDYNL